MRKDFRIHSMCLVKNEGDIIEYCLREALKWSDNIFVYDNKSTDDTWDKVVALSEKDRRIIPWKQSDRAFKESLRAEVFNSFKEIASDGDWWCRLDADEFYVQNPKTFLAKVPFYAHVVWAIFIQYYLTRSDLEEIDFSQPIEGILQKMRYYRSDNSEPRFFRHRGGLIWESNAAWPRHLGLVNRERILLKHYKYRSPHQIQVKIDTRKMAIERGFHGWDYIKKYSNWEDVICDTSKLEYDFKNGKYVIDTKLFPNHIESLPVRIFKLFMHSAGFLP